MRTLVLLASFCIEVILVVSAGNQGFIDPVEYGVKKLDGRMILQLSDDIGKPIFGIAALDDVGEFHFFEMETFVEQPNRYWFLKTPDRNIICDDLFVTVNGSNGVYSFQTLNMIGAYQGSVWYKPLNYDLTKGGLIDTLSTESIRLPYTNGLLNGGSLNDSTSFFISYLIEGQNAVVPFASVIHKNGSWQGDTISLGLGHGTNNMIPMCLREYEGGHLMLSSFYAPNMQPSDYVFELISFDDAFDVQYRKTISDVELGYKGYKFAARYAEDTPAGIFVTGILYDNINTKVGNMVFIFNQNFEKVGELELPLNVIVRDMAFNKRSIFIVGETQTGTYADNEIYLAVKDYEDSLLNEYYWDYGSGHHTVNDAFLGNIDVEGTPGSADERNVLMLTGQFEDMLFYDQWLSWSNIINQPPKRDTKIWPNPTKGVVNIRNSGRSPFNIVVYDLLGRKLNEYKVERGGIDLGWLTIGNYILVIDDGQSIETHKLVVN